MNRVQEAQTPSLQGNTTKDAKRKLAHENKEYATRLIERTIGAPIDGKSNPNFNPFKPDSKVSNYAWDLSNNQTYIFPNRSPSDWTPEDIDEFRRNVNEAQIRVVATKTRPSPYSDMRHLTSTSSSRVFASYTGRATSSAPRQLPGPDGETRLHDSESSQRETPPAGPKADGLQDEKDITSMLMRVAKDISTRHDSEVAQLKATLEEKEQSITSLRVDMTNAKNEILNLQQLLLQERNGREERAKVAKEEHKSDLKFYKDLISREADMHLGELKRQRQEIRKIHQDELRQQRGEIMSKFPDISRNSSHHLAARASPLPQVASRPPSSYPIQEDKSRTANTISVQEAQRKPPIRDRKNNAADEVRRQWNKSPEEFFDTVLPSTMRPPGADLSGKKVIALSKLAKLIDPSGAVPALEKCFKHRRSLQPGLKGYIETGDIEQTIVELANITAQMRSASTPVQAPGHPGHPAQKDNTTASNSGFKYTSLTPVNPEGNVKLGFTMVNEKISKRVRSELSDDDFDPSPKRTRRNSQTHHGSSDGAPGSPAIELSSSASTIPARVENKFGFLGEDLYSASD